jgi:ribosomal protein S18 acetylase RimI-like enzyme
VSLPEHVSRYWRASDRSFQRLRPTWWGAVVTDARYPAIWDVNYARVDVSSGEVGLDDVSAELAPALVRAGVATFHVVCLAPDLDTGVLPALAVLGHGRTWDVVMDLVDDPRISPDIEVIELEPGPALWPTIGESLALFGVDDVDARTQLVRIEAEVLTPAGKRWFGVIDADRVVATAALMVFDGVGHVDNVATSPEARGRGFASAITARLVREAQVAGAEHVMLLADPDAPTVTRLYERLGFRDVGRLASTKGPVADLA